MDRTASRRFDERHVPEPTTGCWLWVGSLNKDGYGRFKVGGRTTQAHRYAYEAQRGSIPAGLELDHRCRTRSCVNPAHLEPVSHATNMGRGSRAMQTVCPKGHDLDEGNTYTWRDVRHCRACRREARRRYLQRARN